MDASADRREPTITMDRFLGVEMRVGRVVSAEWNAKARQPAFVLIVDFGPEIGTRRTSAQLAENYAPDGLVGELVVAVTNLPPKRVAGVESEVLVLAAVDKVRGTVLLRPERDVELGTRIL